MNALDQQTIYLKALEADAKVCNSRAHAIWGRSAFEAAKITEETRAVISAKAKARRAREAYSARKAVVAALSERPGSTTMEIAAAVKCSKAALQRTLAKMADDRIVRRYGMSNKFRWELSA